MAMAITMRSIPVDVNVFAGWVCTAAPEVKTNPRTGEVRADAVTGQNVWVLGLVALRGKDSAVIQVSVPGEPVGVAENVPVRVVGLEASPWEVEGRSGISFRAAAVIPLGAAPGGESAGRRTVLTPPGPGAPGGPGAAGGQSGPGRGGDAS